MPARNLAGAPSAARDRMWRAMRMLRQFRIGELLELCGPVRRKAAEKYIACLVRAEYLRVIKPARGKAGQVYVLVRNTGPFAPRAGRSGVSFDPNLEIVRLRDNSRRLTAELAQIKHQLARLGAFVEKSQPEGSKTNA